MSFNDQIQWAASNRTSVSNDPIPASAVHRLEALRALSTSLLREIDSLQREERIPTGSHIDLSREVQRYEADLIRLALLRTGGRQRQAARLLKVNTSTLHAKIKRLGVHLI